MNMENNIQDIEWIEHYLSPGITPEEKQQMEKRMDAEPELKLKYQKHKQLIAGIRYAHLQDKIKQLRTLESTLPPIEKKAGKEIFANFWKPLAAAAALAVVITSYVLINQPPKPEELYAQYFQPYPNVFEPTLRGAEDEVLSSRTLGFRAYDQGDYSKAAALFKESLIEKEDPGILLLLGNANLVLGNVEEAQNNFLTLIKDFDDLDAQAKLYLGLSYLKQGDSKKAKLILQELGDPAATYSKKAKELLNNLK
jgi:tetratricopeptide (TPR) repeat protein